MKAEDLKSEITIVLNIKYKFNITSATRHANSIVNSITEEILANPAKLRQELLDIAHALEIVADPL